MRRFNKPGSPPTSGIFWHFGLGLGCMERPILPRCAFEANKPTNPNRHRMPVSFPALGATRVWSTSQPCAVKIRQRASCFTPVRYFRPRAGPGFWSYLGGYTPLGRHELTMQLWDWASRLKLVPDGPRWKASGCSSLRLFVPIFSSSRLRDMD